MDFQLKSEHIELDNLLKTLQLVASGAEAKQSIRSGEVKVNGQLESRIRRKLCPGDSVEFRQQHISIVDARDKQAHKVTGHMSQHIMTNDKIQSTK